MWCDRVHRHATRDDPNVQCDTPCQISQRMNCAHLPCKLLDGADTLLKVNTRMRGNALDLHSHEHPAFAPRHDVPTRAPRLGIEDGASPAGLLLDERAGGWRGDFLVTRVEADERARCPKPCEGCENEAVHHEAGLHI